MYPTSAEFKELATTPPVSMEEFTNLMQVLVGAPPPTPGAPLTEEAKRALCILSWSYARLRTRGDDWLARTAAMQAKDLAAEADGLRKVVSAVETALGVKRGSPGPVNHAGVAEVLVGEIRVLQGKALHADLLDHAVNVATKNFARSGTVYDVGEIVRRACQAPCARCAEEMEAARDATAPLLRALTSWSLSWCDESSTSSKHTPAEKWALIGDRVTAILEAVRYLSKAVAARQHALDGIASRVEAATKEFA